MPTNTGSIGVVLASKDHSTNITFFVGKVGLGFLFGSAYWQLNRLEQGRAPEILSSTGPENEGLSALPGFLGFKSQGNGANTNNRGSSKYRISKP